MHKEVLERRDGHGALTASLLLRHAQKCIQILEKVILNRSVGRNSSLESIEGRLLNEECSGAHLVRRCAAPEHCLHPRVICAVV